ncbi:MAG: hypothetical protein D6778_07030, partial [Nitrospirae bacterium]
PPHQQVQADLSLKKFRELFLQGRFCAAEDAFRTAIKKYASVDSPCDLAEAYLQRYLLFSYIGKKEISILAEAERFATLGECKEEAMRIEAYRQNKGLPQAEDPLSRSVSLRKKAMRSGDVSALKKALEIDRAKGWTALVWTDLKGLVELTSGKERERYSERLRLVEETLKRECLP